MSTLFPSFSGRINRGEFFLFSLLWVFFAFIVHSLAQSIGEEVVSLFNLFIFLSFLYPIGFIIRRLHDINIIGGWCFVIFLPVFNLIFLLFLLFAAGTNGPNQYGEQPSDSTHPPRSSLESEKSAANKSEHVEKLCPQSAEAPSSANSSSENQSIFQDPTFQKEEASVPDKKTILKRKIILAAVLLCLAAIPIFSLIQSQKNEHSGFNGYTWGTPLESIEAKEKLLLWDRLASDQSIFVSLKNSASDSAGPPIYYHFQNHTLTHVVIAFTKEEKELYLEEIATLKKKWGVPTTRNRSGFSFLSYSLKNGSILLSDPDDDASDEYYIIHTNELLNSYTDLNSFSSLSLFPQSNRNAKKDPRGFQGYPWGTSPEEIQKHANLIFLENKESPNSQIKIGWDLDTLNSSPTILYWFYEERLMKGTLFYDKDKEEEYQNERDRLTSLFGKPQLNPSDQIGYQFPATLITFLDSEEENSIYYISIKYNKKLLFDKLKSLK